MIFAPTASGKTALALKLFGEGSPYFFKGMAELISADSMAVYRGMDIGTAKPSPLEKSSFTHHLIDIKEPSQQFSVAEFVEKADECARDIYSRGKLPVVLGGTGFYIRSFLLGLPVTPESDPELRKKLIEEARMRGTQAMYQELKEVDRESAEKINENDEYRILRALEVYRLTGRPRSSYALNDTLRKQYDFFTVILERDREELYERINLRVEKMFQEGLENEVKALMSNGLTSESPGMQAIGYREFFSGKTTDEIKEMIKKDSRKYAKKQYVFMKGIPGAKIIQLKTGEEIPESLIQDISGFMEKMWK